MISQAFVEAIAIVLSSKQPVAAIAFFIFSRSTGLDTTAFEACSPARLKVFDGAVQVTVISASSSDKDAKGV